MFDILHIINANRRIEYILRLIFRIDESLNITKTIKLFKARFFLKIVLEQASSTLIRPPGVRMDPRQKRQLSKYVSLFFQGNVEGTKSIHIDSTYYCLSMEYKLNH